MANWFDKLKSGAFGAAKPVTCKNCGREYNPVEHQACPNCELMKETVVMSADEAANARGGPSLIAQYSDSETGEQSESAYPEADGDEPTRLAEPTGGSSAQSPSAGASSGAGGGLISQFAAEDFEFESEFGSLATPAPEAGDDPLTDGELIGSRAAKEVSLDFEFDSPSGEQESGSVGKGGLIDRFVNEDTRQRDESRQSPSPSVESKPRLPGDEEPTGSLEFDHDLFSAGELDLSGDAKGPADSKQGDSDESNPVNWGTVKFDASELTGVPAEPDPSSGEILALDDETSATYLPPTRSDIRIPPPASEPRPVNPSENSETEKTMVGVAARMRGAAGQTEPPATVADDPVVGWLVIVEGPGTGHSKPLGAGINTIGRAPDQQISLYFGSASDKELSRVDHAHVIYDGVHNSFKFQHGKSRNLSYLNNEPVLEVVDLNPYDRIRVGNTTLVFVPFCGEQFSW